MCELVVSLISVSVGAVIGYLLSLLNRIGIRRFICSKKTLKYNHWIDDGTGGKGYELTEEPVNDIIKQNTLIRMEILSFNSSDLPYSISNPTMRITRYNKITKQYDIVKIEHISFDGFDGGAEIIEGHKTKCLVARLTINDVIYKNEQLRFVIKYFDGRGKSKSKKIKNIA